MIKHIRLSKHHPYKSQSRPQCSIPLPCPIPPSTHCNLISQQTLPPCFRTVTSQSPPSDSPLSQSKTQFSLLVGSDVVACPTVSPCQRLRTLVAASCVLARGAAE